MRRITTDNDTSVQKHASCIIDCILRRWYESCEIGELQYRLFSHLIFKLICHTMHWSNSTTRFWTRQMQTLGFLHRVTQVVWVLFFGDYCCWISVRKQKFSPTAYFSQDCVSFNIKKHHTDTLTRLGLISICWEMLSSKSHSTCHLFDVNVMIDTLLMSEHKNGNSISQLIRLIQTVPN